MQRVRMVVDVIGLPWVELHDDIVVVPAEVFDEGHLLPRGRALLQTRPCATAHSVDADVLPRGEARHLPAIAADQHEAPSRLWGGEDEGAVIPRVRCGP